MPNIRGLRMGMRVNLCEYNAHVPMHGHSLETGARWDRSDFKVEMVTVLSMGILHWKTIANLPYWLCIFFQGYAIIAI
jgi:hypothetical protein